MGSRQPSHPSTGHEAESPLLAEYVDAYKECDCVFKSRSLCNTYIDTQLEVRAKKSVRKWMKVKERMASSKGEKGGRVRHM